MLDCEVEEVGGFVHGVGSVGDDRACGGGVVGERLVDASCEGEPVGDGDVGSADVGDLGDFGDDFDEIEAGEDAAFVFGEDEVGCALAGDGSAGGEDPDDGFFGGVLGGGRVTTTREGEGGGRVFG